MKTQAQLDRAADLRLRKTYGISLAEYEKLAKVCNGGCWVCGFIPEKRLHVDHDHGWKKVKIVYGKHEGQWVASAVYKGDSFASFSARKVLAGRGLKDLLRRASVRGLLCYPHNSGLQKFRDNPDYLESAAVYLRKFHRGKVAQILSN